MPWLELRNDDVIFEPGWRLLESAWAPRRKENRSIWPYWSLIENVIDGDMVFHLQKRNNNERYFIGYSLANGDGYITKGLPTQKEHAWKYSEDFYKVNLHKYVEILPHISLSSFFNTNEQFLREYFQKNRSIVRKKKKLFYVIQKNRLQCQNGAYFSEFDYELVQLLVGDFERQQFIEGNLVGEKAKTGELVRTLKARIGQEIFSKNVKNNFYNRCCYPGCDVEGNNFLVAGHIARWSDNNKLRGDTSNGLSLCLMHDKAFEKGYFTLNNDYRIIILRDNIGNRLWLLNYLAPGEGREIKECLIKLSEEAIFEHWQRINYR